MNAPTPTTDHNSCLLKKVNEEPLAANDDTELADRIITRPRSRSTPTVTGSRRAGWPRPSALGRAVTGSERDRTAVLLLTMPMTLLARAARLRRARSPLRAARTTRTCPGSHMQAITRRILRELPGGWQP